MNLGTDTEKNLSQVSGEARGPATRKARHTSFWFLVLTIVLVGLFRMGTPFLAVFFSYYVLTLLNPLRQQWLKVTIFLALVALSCSGLGYALEQTFKHLPKVLKEQTIPAVIQTAKQHSIELPFTDWESLKAFAIDTVTDELPRFGLLAKNATRQVIFLVIGIVIAISIFLNPFSKILKEPAHADHENVYTLYASEIAARFSSFYRSFAKVMGAQLIISTINTTLTAIFILSVGMPYPAIGIGVTFICGLLPIVGNLISNTIIVGIGFTIDPNTALIALIFLVAIHKLEYFLNSKIVGWRIRNPLWLTLLGLVIGERLMGVPGMILAPVLLHYLKVEMSAKPAE